MRQGRDLGKARVGRKRASVRACALAGVRSTVCTYVCVMGTRKLCQASERDSIKCRVGEWNGMESSMVGFNVERRVLTLWPSSSTSASTRLVFGPVGRRLVTVSRVARGVFARSAHTWQAALWGPRLSLGCHKLGPCSTCELFECTSLASASLTEASHEPRATSRSCRPSP